jgi:hypothetical protein
MMFGLMLFVLTGCVGLQYGKIVPSTLESRSQPESTDSLIEKIDVPLSAIKPIDQKNLIPPVNFQVYPGAVLNTYNKSTNEYIYSVDADATVVAEYLIKTLKEDGWYAVGTTFASYIAADKSHDIFVVDGRGAWIAFITVYNHSSTGLSDGYTVCFDESASESRPIIYRPGYDLNVEELDTSLIYPGSYLSDYSINTEQSAEVKVYSYYTEVDFWFDQYYDDIRDFYIGFFKEKKWDIIFGENYYTDIIAELDNKEMQIRIIPWGFSGVDLGFEIIITTITYAN